MITLRELDSAQVATLRQVIEGKLTFRARHAHGPHYVWGADSSLPRTAYSSEIALVYELIVKGLLTAPDVLQGAQLVEPTSLGQSLYRQAVDSARTPVSTATEKDSPPSDRLDITVDDWLGTAVQSARLALEAVDSAPELTDAQTYARTQLAAGLELLKASRTGLVSLL